MIHLSTSLKYYKREDVQKALVWHAIDKEVAARFNEQFGKRPDTLTYPGDVLELARQGATSFHCSEELWTNPLLLQPQMQRKELDKLRKGWDLLLDVDTDSKDKETGFEYSKIAADLITGELKKHGITSVTAKFSGNKGFHIAVPYEAFPKSFLGKETKDRFPEAPKKIAAYLKERTITELGRRVLQQEKGDYKAIAEKTGKDVKEFAYMKPVKGGLESERELEFNAEPFLVIDTLLISSRHMYRMPYSLHEKSGLASVPVDTKNIMTFSKDVAAPKKVKVGEFPFMDRTNVVPGEATRFLNEVYDFAARNIQLEERKKRLENKKPTYGELEEIEGKIPPQYFPPCIKNLLQGLGDGRKRALFVLINFLGSCNYGHEEIEAVVKEWNQKNKEPLPQLYLQSQLSYNKQKNEKVLPPNCSNASYYSEIGIVCTPECGRCKNPVAEAKQIYRRAMRIVESQKPVRKKKVKDSGGKNEEPDSHKT